MQRPLFSYFSTQNAHSCTNFCNKLHGIGPAGRVDHPPAPQHQIVHLRLLRRSDLSPAAGCPARGVAHPARKVPDWPSGAAGSPGRWLKLKQLNNHLALKNKCSKIFLVAPRLNQCLDLKHKNQHLESPQKVALMPRVSGIIEQIEFKEGDAVKQCFISMNDQ